MGVHLEPWYEISPLENSNEPLKQTDFQVYNTTLHYTAILSKCPYKIYSFQI